MQAREEREAFVPVTRTEWANHRLRQAILSGELRPGEKLVATSLAKTWNISPTPLREAFVRLAASGLVELTPQRGARVAPISVEEAAEIFELRLLLEPAALERSFQNTDEQHLDAAQRALGDLEASLDSEDIERITTIHRRFHATLLERTPGTWLAKFCNTLSEHSGRYQLLSPMKDEQTEIKMQQHQLLVQALRDGDTDAGTKVLFDHLSQSLERIRGWASALEGTPSNDGGKVAGSAPATASHQALAEE